MITETTLIDPCETLNALVARAPETLPVLKRYGLDTCCGGALPLATAAEHHDLDLDALVADLRAALAHT